MGFHNNEYVAGEVSNTHEMIHATFLFGKLDGRVNLGGKGVGRKLILKLIFNKDEMRLWTRFDRFRTESSSCLL